MARSKSRGKRDISFIATSDVLSSSSSFLTDYEDRRLFNFDPFPPAASFSQPRHRLVIGVNVNKNQRVTKYNGNPFSRLSSVVAFRNPRKVLICVRRKVRRQVLHALKLRGKGAGARRHRMSSYSSISCR